jgi:hypothetical protein
MNRKRERNFWEGRKNLFKMEVRFCLLKESEEWNFFRTVHREEERESVRVNALVSDK